MAIQVKQIITALKGVLREQGVTYKQLAHEFNVSESTIKRQLTNERLSLRRLQELCDFTDTNLFDLVQIIDREQQRADILSYYQEQRLVSEPILLLVCIACAGNLSFQTICQRYEFGDEELAEHFNKLDKLGIVDLLPGQRYRLNVSKDFRWLPQGPIATYFREHIAERILSTSFASSTHKAFLKFANLSPIAAKSILIKLEKLLQEYTDVEHDEFRSPDHEKVTTSIMLVFEEAWRDQDLKSLWVSTDKHSLA